MKPQPFRVAVEYSSDEAYSVKERRVTARTGREAMRLALQRAAHAYGVIDGVKHGREVALKATLIKETR